MIYSEAAFYGVPVAHCAAWDETKRLSRIDATVKKIVKRQPRRRNHV